MCENIQKCCRICLNVESDHVPILGDPTIQLQMKSCLAMTISANDHLPKKICSSCVSQLSDFYNFQLNARCSQDWLESAIEEQANKAVESKAPVQPLPDSEYNSDSLLEFLNNTANIEEYLNNLGKEDIPSICNIIDRNQENLDKNSKITTITKPKQSSPKKKDIVKTKSCSIKMEIDVLDSDVEIVKEIIMKEIEPKKNIQMKEKPSLTCFACKAKFENLQIMSRHIAVCDLAQRTCLHCNLLFDSKFKMQQHSVTHNNESLTCSCGKQYPTEEKLSEHFKSCHVDYTAAMGCTYRCKQCNQTFQQRFQLYKHAKQHILKAEERTCDICRHILIGNEALERHKKEVHQISKNDLYRCKICSYTSKTHREIFVHVQNHCAPPAPPDRHLCHACGASFASRASLQRHSVQHDAGHRCSICQKVFSTVELRDQHVLGHIEMTMCDKCGENLTSYKLQKHCCM